VRTTFITCQEHDRCVAVFSVDPDQGTDEIAPPRWAARIIDRQEGGLVAISHVEAKDTLRGVVIGRRWWRRKRA
jgi:hypothetical protein